MSPFPSKSLVRHVHCANRLLAQISTIWAAVPCLKMIGSLLLALGLWPSANAMTLASATHAERHWAYRPIRAWPTRNFGTPCCHNPVPLPWCLLWPSRSTHYHWFWGNRQPHACFFCKVNWGSNHQIHPTCPSGRWTTFPSIVGETKIYLTRDGHTLILEALVVETLDSLTSWVVHLSYGSQ